VRGSWYPRDIIDIHQKARQQPNVDGLEMGKEKPEKEHGI